MMPQENIDFKSYAAGYALEALLELFTERVPYLGGDDRIVSEARRIAEEMDKQKTDDFLIDFLAVRAMKGILIGNYHNYYKEQRMPGTGVYIEPFVRKCYKIAEMAVSRQELDKCRPGPLP